MHLNCCRGCLEVLETSLGVLEDALNVVVEAVLWAVEGNARQGG